MELPNIPHHVAIIMDGNGRWGENRYGTRTSGHYAGAMRAKEIVRAAGECGIGILTLFAFSSENWQRPEYEVRVLMNLFKKFMLREIDELDAKCVCVKFIGDRSRLPKKLQRIMAQVEARTDRHKEHILQIALSYGGRADLTAAMRKIAQEVECGNLKPEDITEEIISNSLWTAGIPDPDLVIRTGGNMRTSNFLPWQCVYAEYEFVPTLWPDFMPEQFTEIVGRFASRQRRFGNVITKKVV